MDINEMYGGSKPIAPLLIKRKTKSNGQKLKRATSELYVVYQSKRL